MSARWAHQEKEFKRYAAPSRAILWQPRTGKSRLIIDEACALHQAMEISGVLVIAPNGVHVNWQEVEIPKHASSPSTRSNLFTWRFSSNKNELDFELFLQRIKEAPTHLHWLMINMEALSRDEVKKAVKRFKKLVGRFMVVFDESHHFASPGAKRTRAARGIARLASYRRILSGTTVENAPLQAFSQFELLEPGALGHKTYGSFCREHATYELKTNGSRQYKAVSGYQNLEILKERMAKHSSVVLRQDCGDLPAIQEVIRYVELTDGQSVAWRAVKKKEIFALEAMGLDKPLNAGAALIKLQQIEGGFLKTEQGLQEWNTSREDPALNACMEEVTSIDGSTIIWCQFIHEIKAICLRLASEGIRHRAYHGTVPPKERDQIRLDFREHKFKVLVGTASSAGEGQDFSAADVIIWYSQTPDAIVRNQASERATKVGKKSVQIVHLIVKGGVNERWKKLTDEKTTLASDMSREGLQRILRSLEI